MKIEIEAKFLGANIDQVRKDLLSIGGKLVAGERLMRRANFDFPDMRLEMKGGWVRIRDEVSKITLTYKQLNDRNLLGTQEVNLEVDSFENAKQLLISVGLEQKSYQETKRESWRYGNTEVEIDTWPGLAPFIEVEAPDEQAFLELVNLLHLEDKEKIYGSVEAVYEKYYKVSAKEVIGWPVIDFKTTPNLLTGRRL